jgi:uncharacterized membrane protein
MTTLTQETTTEGQLEPKRSDESGGRWAARLLVPEMWASVSIAVMWLAVLFVGVFAGDMTFNDASTGVTIIPSAVGVALFASIGTVAVARRAFGRRRDVT